MTFRESVQIQIKALMEVYDNAGYLRDVVVGNNEKTHLNHVRRDIREVWEHFQKLDNSLSPELANYQVTGDYSISVKQTNI